MLWLVLGAALLIMWRNSQSAVTSSPASGAQPPSAGGFSSTVQAIANAIATAEGYFASGNPLPYRQNNPGDLRDSSGAIATYDTAADGWNALYRQVQKMLDGTSAFYGPDQTIAQIAVTYTGADNAPSWAATVAQVLGVDPSTPIGDVTA